MGTELERLSEELVRSLQIEVHTELHAALRDAIKFVKERYPDGLAPFVPIVDPRIARFRELASQAIGPLAAIERELTTSGILAGAEIMAVAAQCATLRLMLQQIKAHFGDPDPLLPAIRFEPPIGYR